METKGSLCVYICFLYLCLGSLPLANLLCPIPLCLILSNHIILYYMLDSFLMRDRKQVNPDGKRGGEKLGRVEGKDTIIRIYSIKRNLF